MPPLSRHTKLAMAFGGVVVCVAFVWLVYNALISGGKNQTEESKNDPIIELQKELHDVEKKLSLATSNLSQQHSALAYWQGQMLQWQQTWQKEKLLTQQLQQERKNLTANLEAKTHEFSAKTAEWEAKRQDLADHIAQLSSKLTKSEQQTQLDHERIEQLTRQIERLRRLNASLNQAENELSGRTAEQNQATAPPTITGNRTGSTTTIIQKYESKLAELTQRLERRDRSRAEAEILRSELAAERDQMLLERDQSRAALLQAQKLLENSNNQIQDLRDELAQNKQIINELDARKSKNMTAIPSAELQFTAEEEKLSKSAVNSLRHKILTRLYTRLAAQTAKYQQSTESTKTQDEK